MTKSAKTIRSFLIFGLGSIGKFGGREQGEMSQACLVSCSRSSEWPHLGHNEFVVYETRCRSAD